MTLKQLSNKLYESKILHDYKDGKIDYIKVHDWIVNQKLNMMNKVTMKLKDYGELVGEYYSFGDATITISLEDYTELVQKRNEKLKEQDIEKEINRFYRDVEEYINTGYSLEQSQIKRVNIMKRFNMLPDKTKNKLYHTLSETTEENKDLKYMGQIANINILLKELKQNL